MNGLHHVMFVVEYTGSIPFFWNQSTNSCKVPVDNKNWYMDWYKSKVCWRLKRFCYGLYWWMTSSLTTQLQDSSAIHVIIMCWSWISSSFTKLKTFQLKSELTWCCPEAYTTLLKKKMIKKKINNSPVFI